MRCIARYPKIAEITPITSVPISRGCHIRENTLPIHSILASNFSKSGSIPKIIFPNSYPRYIIGGIVIGLLTQTPARERGQLALKYTAQNAAGII